MSAYRFSVGKRFQWIRKGQPGTEAFEITRVLDQGVVQLENLLTGHSLRATIAELVAALFDGHLQFEVCGRVAKPHANPSPQPSLATQPRHADLSDVPAHLVAIARRRLEILQPLLALSSQARTRWRVVEHVAQIQQRHTDADEANAVHAVPGLADAISVTSVYRWMHNYMHAGCDLRALIPNTAQRGGTGRLRIDPEVESLLDIVIKEVLLHRECASQADVRHELTVRIRDANQLRSHQEQLRLPSLATIQRRIASLDLQSRLKATQGARAAKRAFKQHGHTPQPSIPLERVEIDHTRLDVIVVDNRDGLPLGRPTLTHCLDYATRYPLGYYIGFEPPSWYAVMECLHHAICPKVDTQERFGTQHGWSACGVPVTLRIDNGKEFLGRDLKDACVLLGIVLEQAPVLCPEFKPGVERMFGTLNTGFIHALPGTTFSDPGQRGDYDASRQACVTLNDFERMFNVFIVDIYAQRFHRGLNGIPARRWEHAEQAVQAHAGFSPRLPASRDELLVLLGRAETRILQHYGVELEGLRYNCPELAPLRHRLNGAPAKVKFHPGDLSVIHVYDPFDKRYVAVPALDAEYAQGLSLWKHRVIKRYAREELGRVDLVALGEARRHIKQIINDARQHKHAVKRAAARAVQPGLQAARFKTGDQPPSQRKRQLQHASHANDMADGFQHDVSLSALLELDNPSGPGVDTDAGMKPKSPSSAKNADGAEDNWEIVLAATHPTPLEANR